MSKQYDCEVCHDTGEIRINAEQVWSPERGTHIRDEYFVPCQCQKVLNTKYDEDD